jgi:ribose 5-phosphate isomerase B
MRGGVVLSEQDRLEASSLPLAFASDHAGFALKSALIEHAQWLGHGVLDLGTDSEESVDYPDFGAAMGAAIAKGQAACGVIVCGTGIGISIAANRNPAVRAALCHNATAARLAREHNDANVLAMGARLLGSEVAKDCLETFLSTAYQGGRHARRVAKLS